MEGSGTHAHGVDAQGVCFRIVTMRNARWWLSMLTLCVLVTTVKSRNYLCLKDECVMSTSEIPQLQDSSYEKR